MKKYFNIRILCILLVFTVVASFTFIPGPVYANNGILKVSFLKVSNSGRSDCILVELPNNSKMVVDVPEGGSANLISKLNAMGYTQIKYLVGTHDHGDHIGGMNNFINDFSINNTEIYYPRGAIHTKSQNYTNLVNASNNKGLTIKKLDRGDTILDTTYDGKILKINVIAPIPYRVDGGTNDYTAENPASLVITVQYGNKGLILTGDALENTEADILAEADQSTLWGQVLKVGHHGVKSGSPETGYKESTTAAWLDSMDINFAFMTNDDANINSALKTRLQSRGIPYWIIGPQGDCSIECDGEVGHYWIPSKAAYWEP